MDKILFLSLGWLSRVSGEGLRCSPRSLHSGWLELHCLPSAMRPLIPVSLSAASPSPPIVAFLSKTLPKLTLHTGNLGFNPGPERSLSISGTFLWLLPLWSPVPQIPDTKTLSYLCFFCPERLLLTVPALLPSAVVGKMPQAQGQSDCGLTSASVCSFSQANCLLLSPIISRCQKWSVHVCCPVLESSGVGESVQQH